MLKKVKWASLAMALAYTLGGLFMFMYPSKVAEFVCLIAGIVLIVLGVINIITYFTLDINLSLYRNDLASGAVKILIGVMVIYYREKFGGMLSYVLSMLIIVSGFFKLQDGIDAYRIGYAKSVLYIVLASISLVLGLVILFGMNDVSELMLRVAGAGMLYCGITDLISVFYLSGKIKKFMTGEDPMTQEEVEKVPLAQVEDRSESQQTDEE